MLDHEAKAIRAATVADPERTVADIIAADRVIATYSDPEGDVEAADKMLRDLRQSDNNYRLDRATVYRREADKFERLFRETMSGVKDEPKRQRIRVEGVNVGERLESLIDGMSFKYGHTDEDFDEAFRARRALVLQGEFGPAEAVLAKYVDTSAEPPHPAWRRKGTKLPSEQQLSNSWAAVSQIAAAPHGRQP